MRKKPTAIPQTSEYQLTFADKPDPAGIMQATLVALGLSETLHLTGTATVNIYPSRERSKKRGFVLDSFEIKSLEDYIRLQSSIVDVLESELPRDQEKWDPKGKSVRGSLWKSARVDSLELRRRDVASPDLVAELRESLTDDELKQELAAYDDVATISIFTVVLECDWDEEHQVRAEFRNGALLRLDHE
jgi:hypothetical protein